jgi:hypothetical protein
MDADIDDAALARLHGYVVDAIGRQDVHVADQLRAAMADGKTSFRIVERDARPAVAGVVAGGTFVVVEVDGRDVCEVDVLKLV